MSTTIATQLEDFVPESTGSVLHLRLTCKKLPTMLPMARYTKSNAIFLTSSIKSSLPPVSVYACLYVCVFGGGVECAHMHV
jgi:hypothetical protein